jgi:pimeloyl-ACP methyl ester carboxylesterase
MNHYADDLADLTQHLDLRDAVHVGHSAGGGEVARYVGRHGESRVAKVILISAVTPSVLQTDTNPVGVPKPPSRVCKDSWQQTVRSSTEPYRPGRSLSHLGPARGPAGANGTLKTYAGFPHGMPTTRRHDQRRPAYLHPVLIVAFLLRQRSTRLRAGWRRLRANGRLGEDYSENPIARS